MWRNSVKLRSYKDRSISEQDKSRNISKNQMKERRTMSYLRRNINWRKKPKSLTYQMMMMMKTTKMISILLNHDYLWKRNELFKNLIVLFFLRDQEVESDYIAKTAKIINAKSIKLYQIIVYWWIDLKKTTFCLYWILIYNHRRCTIIELKGMSSALSRTSERIATLAWSVE